MDATTRGRVDALEAKQERDFFRWICGRRAFLVFDRVELLIAGDRRIVNFKRSHLLLLRAQPRNGHHATAP